MKKIAFVFVVSGVSMHASAQDSAFAHNGLYTVTDARSNSDKSHTLKRTIIWSVGLEPTTPIGHFNEYAGFGFGGSLQGELKTRGSIGFTLNAGYIAYSGKNANGVNYSTFKYWPVMGGIKWYIGRAFVHGQAGAGFGEQGLGTSFWYGGGVGTNFTKRIDAEFRYEGWKQSEVGTAYGEGAAGNNGGTPGGSYGGHYSTLGLRIAVNF